jgi:hypothetical protein
MVEGPDMESKPYEKLVNTRKVNIGTEENLKLTQIGDYWDEKTVEKIVELLHEYQGLFPSNL